MTSLGVDNLAQLRTLAAHLESRAENEADTRQKIIDIVLRDVLSRPRNRVSIEEYIKPRFADFVLRKSNDAPLTVEAKRAGVSFTLPHPHHQHELSCYINIGKLLSDDNIREAMTQVRAYCIDTCITNGHEWILFKTFEKGKRWEKSSTWCP